MADGGRALCRRALLQPRQGAIPGFRPVLGVRLRTAARGNVWAQRTRQHLRTRSEVHQGAGPGQAEPAAIRRHAVLRSRQDRRRNRTDDGDLAGSRRRGAVVDHARSQTRLENDPEKWIPVFPRDKREAFARRSCSKKKIERDDDSKESHPALAERPERATIGTDRYRRISPPPRRPVGVSIPPAAHRSNRAWAAAACPQALPEA